MQIHQIEQHWGKAQSIGDGPAWHPLAYHSLDVAASMLALLEADPARIGPLIALGGGNPEAIKSGLVLAAALHDLGKFAPAFQAKATHVPPGEKRRGTTLVDKGHDLSGGYIWRAFGARLLDGPDEAVDRIKDWVRAACCHHGRGRPTYSECNDKEWVEEYVQLADEDLKAIMAYISFVLEIEEVGNWRSLPEPQEDGTEEAWVVGLITQADWIGSNTDFFPYHQPTLCAADYWGWVKGKAKVAIEKAGLNISPRNTPLSLSEALQIDGEVKPTPLQLWAETVEIPKGPCLTILEDLTGAGKTEAATILASRLVASGKASGVYWAMPTMATANAMYSRAAPLARTVYGEEASAVLMGGKRNLNELFRQARLAAKFGTQPYSVAGEETIPAEVHCSEWLSRDGRVGFLAPVGAGTIDQALLGILRSRHFPVRLAGLGARILIIDEAHAYDAYTGGLLEKLLEQHAKAGGSAIILSATLTSELQQKLIKAWRLGRRDRTPPSQPLPLPCASMVAEGVQAAETFAGEGARGTKRDTPVEWIREPQAAADLLAKVSADGASGIWIRNTVGDAREAVALLEERGVKPMLFHSRLTAGDRKRVEEDLLARFGREGKDRAGIVVSTQVAEQSLDVDFDLMISDLAPYDSLIQRAGRLHRHKRMRPAGYERPILYVHSPEPCDESGEDWYSKSFPSAAYVYEVHGRLWRTAKRMELDGAVPLASARPRDLLDWVYSEDEGTPEALAMRDLPLEEGKNRGEYQQGKAAAVELENGYIGDAFLKEERAVTRLGEPSVPVLLARQEGNALMPWDDEDTGWRAWAMSEISVPESKVGDGIVPEGLEGAVSEITNNKSWIRIWVLNAEGRGEIRRGDQVVEVRYGPAYGLVLSSPHVWG